MAGAADDTSTPGDARDAPRALNVTLEIDAPVDDVVIAQALARTVAAHPALADAHLSAEPVVTRLDLRGIPEPERRGEAFAAAAKFCELPTGGDGHRLRALHVHTGSASLLALAIDPSVCDAWSANLVSEEIAGYLDAYFDGTEPPAPAPDTAVAVLAERAAIHAGPHGRAAVEAARTRGTALTPLWWDSAGAAPISSGVRRQLADLDDAVATELNQRCRTARASLFPLALLALQLMQPDPLVPRAVISTFAGRETEADHDAVGHLATDVMVPVALRGITVAESLTAIRDAVFDILSSPPVDWREVTPRPSEGEDGLSMSVLYLPAQLSGGGAVNGSSRVTRASVSVCPTDADLDLFVIERPPVDNQGRTPLLRLGGILNRTDADLDVKAVIDGWAELLTALATTPGPWDALPWPDVALSTRGHAGSGTDHAAR